MKKFFVILGFLIFCLPVFAGTQEIMSQVIRSWIGENIDNAIRVLNYPDQEKTLAGRHLFFWNKNVAVGQDAYGYKKKYVCEIILEVDSSNIINGGSWKGNNCPYMYYGPVGAKYLFNPKNDARQIEKETKKAVKAERKSEKQYENSETE